MDKKHYESPEMDVILINGVNIITMSGDEDIDVES